MTQVSNKRKKSEEKKKINSSMETLLGNISKFQCQLYYRQIEKYKKTLKNFQDKYFAFG
jgi:DNA-binding transcriptional regulator of glucitol operon